ncbi:amidohydrolase [Flammeovirgaceae bacterium SG7u.111]|nr:amidohydrolase [Flammeovirgaceae bacterium SG7u.132]WPO35302.1 amidohydrolase [Flammeovirgaceae bacterium SG7u.111]
MDILKVTLIQTELYWESPSANLAHLEELIWGNRLETDLIILPEMFTTGFTMNAAKLAEPMNLSTFKWMAQMAKQTGACMVGSYIVKEKGEFFNRLVWMQPNGNYSTYDKRHSFRMAKEHEVYSAGTERLVVELKGWKISPLICYDLRFPVWSRNNSEDMYDLLLYVANWPQRRQSAWQTLLPARAVENLAYSIGVNRIGEDGNRIAYGGGSQVCDYLGNRLADLQEEELVKTVELDGAKLQRYREKFPAQLDADKFEIL